MKGFTQEMAEKIKKSVAGRFGVANPVMVGIFNSVCSAIDKEVDHDEPARLNAVPVNCSTCAFSGSQNECRSANPCPEDAIIEHGKYPNWKEKRTGFLSATICRDRTDEWEERQDAARLQKAVTTQTWELAGEELWKYPNGSPLATSGSVGYIPEPARPPVPWREGWLAWWSAWNEIVIVESVDAHGVFQGRAKSAMCSGNVLNLFLPTRAQLAVTIPGTDVKAWARNISGEWVRVYLSCADEFVAPCIYAHNVNIVPADQVEACYGSVFPPKE